MDRKVMSEAIKALQIVREYSQIYKKYLTKKEEADSLKNDHGPEFLLAEIDISGQATMKETWRESRVDNSKLQKLKIHYRIADYLAEPMVNLFLQVSLVAEDWGYSFCISEFDNSSHNDEIDIQKKSFIHNGTYSYKVTLDDKSFKEVLEFCSKTIEEFNIFSPEKIKKIEGL